MATTVKI